MKAEFQQLLQKFIEIQGQDHLHHAILLIGKAETAIIQPLILDMAAFCFCPQSTPCGSCKSCLLLAKNEHPDLNYIRPDKEGGLIQIDQIRELQSNVYTSAQLAAERIICIMPANKMNNFAANALLKILEEPHEHLRFILVAEEINHMLPTILSRCQKWRLPTKDIITEEYLAIAEAYPKESPRGELFAQWEEFLKDLINLNQGKVFSCSFAEKWKTYGLSDILWLLYLITAQMIQLKIRTPATSADKPAISLKSPLIELAKKFKVIDLFKQIDEINEISLKLNHNINVNQTLVFENLLLEYTVS